MLTVAIIGRPNVGKSTLFNRLTGTRHALVDDQPGVTRDRREGVGRLARLEFNVFDTAGLEQAETDSLADRMTKQTLLALEDADIVLMVVDGRAGVTPLDEHFAGIVRKSGKPAAVLVNKAEGSAANETMLEVYRFGFGEPIAISAEHGEGMADLYTVIAVHEPKVMPGEEIDPDGEPEEMITMAVVGRPNAGKSTLINYLLGKERLLTGPEAGITRDAITVPFEWQGQKMQVVDTAGMRRKSNIHEKLEKMSVGDSLRSIRYANVVVIMMDATDALEKQDLQIASLIEQEGRALVLAINKWDLVPREIQRDYLKAVDDRMGEVLRQIRGVSVVPISSLNGHGVSKLMKAVFDAYEVWNKRIPTGELNRWLEYATQKHTPPLLKGRRLKIRYITQAKSRPPTFMLSSNLKEMPTHYERYLIGGLRDNFGLNGVPVRLKIRKKKNPYEEKA